MRRRLRLTVFLSFGLAAGCSIVNSIDDVKPADDGTFTGAPRPDASVVLDEAGPVQPTADAEAGGPTGATHPVLLVGGEVDVGDAGARQPVLTALDPTTGQEIAQRQTMWVAGIGHDSQRDLWYVFEAPTYFIAGPTDTVKLHIRKLDSSTGGWTELSELDVPPLVYYDAIGVTTQRVSFIAQAASGKTLTRLVTIDTTDPAAPSQIDAQEIPQTPRGVIATKSTTGPGGRLSLLNAGANQPDAGPECETFKPDGGASYTLCSALIRHYLIPNGGVPSALPPTELDAVPNEVMTSSAQPAYGSVICGGGPDDVIVMPGGGPGAGTQTVVTADYQLGTATGTPKTFTMSTAVATPSTLRRAAIDNSRRLVFVVEANSDTNLYAVSLDGSGGAISVPLRHSGQSVYYDPASETVFAPFNQGDGFSFSPFKVSGTNSLKERVSGAAGDWNPPNDLRPLILGIQDPVSESCP